MQNIGICIDISKISIDCILTLASTMYCTYHKIINKHNRFTYSYAQIIDNY